MKGLRTIGKFLDRMFAATFALIFMQVPVFFEQYVEEVSSSKAKIQEIYEETRFQALDANYSVMGFLDHLLEGNTNQDSVLLIKSAIERYQKDEVIIKDLTSGEWWTHPWKFYKHYDSNLYQAMRFEPGLPWSWEGLVYGILGILIWGFLVWLIGRPIRRKIKEERL